ncbi:hypothetical protein HELRODRAFT_152136, partial [Helobdella robusta]|uniref:Glucuronosyltransferase n=1 Tax=Helobdella robusta TaxID=6412 RepID=T1EKP4_HELRO
GHQATKLFITHGGLNSIIESVNHKKPIIVVPIGIDQISNAAMAVKKGYALTMPLDNSLSVNDFITNIKNVIAANSTYKKNAEFYSEILRDKPVAVGKRVSRLIEQVLEYGDNHLRSSAFELNALQFFMFDVFAAIIAVFIFVVVFIF